MKKTKCSKCGAENLEKDTLCFGCGVPIVTRDENNNNFVDQLTTSQSRTESVILIIIFMVIIIICMGFFHFVGTGDGFTIVPKASISFSNTFTSVDDVIKQYNNRSLGEALRGNSQLDSLVNELQNRGYISHSTPTPPTPTPIPEVQGISPAEVSVDYSDMKSVLLDGNKAEGKILQIEAEYDELQTSGENPYILAWIGSFDEGTRTLWHVYFGRKFNDQVRGFNKGSKFNMTCRINDIQRFGSKCILIKLIPSPVVPSQKVEE